jgi:hypothetical protein
MVPLFQTPLINDIGLATGVVIGRGWVPASDLPVIQKFLEDQVLDGESNLRIWAENIITSNFIGRVWANIHSPLLQETDYNDPKTDKDEEVVKINLFDTDNDGTYEAMYDGFRAYGKYNVTIHAIDIKDQQSLPYHTIIEQTRPLVGDISGNGEINLSDAVLGMQIMTGNLDSYRMDAVLADVNDDGLIDFRDILFIMQKALRN